MSFEQRFGGTKFVEDIVVCHRHQKNSPFACSFSLANPSIRDGGQSLQSCVKNGT
jgi:hypothetical protein